MKWLWSPELSSVTALSLKKAMANSPGWNEGKEWEINSRVFKVQKMTRADALGEDWRMVLKIMEKLASRYGDDQVRLVVWFNS